MMFRTRRQAIPSKDDLSREIAYEQAGRFFVSVAQGSPQTVSSMMGILMGAALKTGAAAMKHITRADGYPDPVAEDVAKVVDLAGTAMWGVVAIDEGGSLIKDLADAFRKGEGEAPRTYDVTGGGGNVSVSDNYTEVGAQGGLASTLPNALAAAGGAALGAGAAGAAGAGAGALAGRLAAAGVPIGSTATTAGLVALGFTAAEIAAMVAAGLIVIVAAPAVVGGIQPFFEANREVGVQEGTRNVGQTPVAGDPGFTPLPGLPPGIRVSEEEFQAIVARQEPLRPTTDPKLAARLQAERDARDRETIAKFRRSQGGVI